MQCSSIYSDFRPISSLLDWIYTILDRYWAIQKYFLGNVPRLIEALK